eukprot:4908241-Prymnesium_polylepis.1
MGSWRWGGGLQRELSDAGDGGGSGVAGKSGEGGGDGGSGEGGESGEVIYFKSRALQSLVPVSYTHLRAHETLMNL